MVNKKLENEIISKWVGGKISTDDMTKVLGEEESERIILFRKTLKQSILDGLELGKQLTQQ